MRIVSCLLVVLLAGCGYHTPGSSGTWVGGDARRVYIQLFDNRTVEPYLENYITNALVDELSRSRLMVLTEDQALADVRLVGEVKTFSSNALAYGSDDRITYYRASMDISARLLSKNSGQAVWQQSFQRTEDYLGTVNKNLQLEGERLAAQQISQRLAEDIYSSLLNSF